MRLSTAPAVAAAGLLMCATAGCYAPLRSPYGYGPNGYYPSNPGMGYPGGGIPTLTPGAPYLPGGTVVPNGVPSGTNPTFEQRLTPTPDATGGDAPTFNSGAPSNTQGNVPYYPDANSNSEYLPPATRPNNEPANGNSPFFDEPQGSAPAAAGPGPFGSAAPGTPTIDAQPLAAAATAGAATSDSRIVAVVQKASGLMTNPFAYDADEYRWLRGILSFDDADRTWNLTYSVDPDVADVYSGHITLEKVPRAHTLHDGDLVVVEGHVNPTAPDRFGKATYQVANLQRIAYQ